MLREIREICREYNFRPSRRRGQNFLINKGILEKIIAAADLKKDDLVLEVGAGLGFLTEELAKRVKKVLAIEIDKNLVEVLKERLKNYENVKIVKEDILGEEAEKIILKWLNSGKKFLSAVRSASADLTWSSPRSSDPRSEASPLGCGDRQKPFPSFISSFSKYKIVANLPYNITSRFLRNFLSAKFKPELMVLMVQKEVGKRITASPSPGAGQCLAPKMSKLSVMVQFYGQPKIVFLVKKSNFWPKPKVESVILKISEIKRRLNVNEERFFEMVRAGFLSPRKYLLNNLKKAGLRPWVGGEEILKKIGLSPKIRAQELSIENWLKLVEL